MLVKVSRLRSKSIMGVATPTTQDENAHNSVTPSEVEGFMATVLDFSAPLEMTFP